MAKRIGTFALITALAALGSPAVASAKPSSPHKKAARQCKALRAEMGRHDFAQAFGTNRRKTNAFRKCVSKRGVLPKPASVPLVPCPATEPPLPVHAFVVGPCPGGPEPPLSAGEPPGTDDADEADQDEAEDEDNAEADEDEGEDDGQDDPGHDEDESDD
jgi:hypothetical protein